MPDGGTNNEMMTSVHPHAGMENKRTKRHCGYSPRRDEILKVKALIMNGTSRLMCGKFLVFSQEAGPSVMPSREEDRDDQ